MMPLQFLFETFGPALLRARGLPTIGNSLKAIQLPDGNILVGTYLSGQVMISPLEQAAASASGAERRDLIDRTVTKLVEQFQAAVRPPTPPSEDLTPDARYQEPGFAAFNARRLSEENVLLREALVHFKSAAINFIAKVDSGQARSVQTYRELQAALDAAEKVQL